MVKRLIGWIRNNYLLLTVVAVGGVLRFFRLRDLTTFGGDQGVDYQKVARMILERDLTLLGPVTHVGIYLGPLYYYLLIPFFILFRFDPIAAPLMFALFGTATVGLVYLLARKVFGEEFRIPNVELRITAALAALLYAVSPVIVESSRAPSQPHLIPFFATLLLISCLRITRGKATRWDGLAIGISLSSVIQFHYLAFPLFLVAGGVLFLYKGLSLGSLKDNPFKGFWIYLVGSMGVLLLPWGLFELRHDFFITKQIVGYLGSGEVGLQPVAVGERFLDLIWFSFDRLVGQRSQLVTAAVLVAAIAGVVKEFWKDYSWSAPTIIFLGGYGLVNVLGIALYTDPLANHYISALYPVVILLTVMGLMAVLGRRLGWVAGLGLVVYQLRGYDPTRGHGYTMPAGVTTGSIQAAAELIAEDVKDHRQSFNVANTLDGDTRAHPYRYLLTAVHRTPPQSVENYPESSFLYIVSRDSAQELLGDNRWELASFPVAGVAIIDKSDDQVYLYRWERGDVSRQEVINQVKELRDQ